MQPREDKDQSPKALSPGEQAVIEVLEKAGAQYRDYLEAAQLSSLARLVAAPSVDRPPRTDLPLTLTVG